MGQRYGRWPETKVSWTAMSGPLTLSVERRDASLVRCPGTGSGIAEGRDAGAGTGSSVLLITGHKSGTAGQREEKGFVSHDGIHQIVVADKNSEAEARLQRGECTVC